MKKNGFKIPYWRELKKLLLIMKLSIVLTITCLFQIQASVLTYSQSTRLTLKMEGATMKEVFDEIEKNSEFIFIYYNDIVTMDQKIDINIKDAPIDKVLDKLFESTGNAYEVLDRQVVIKPKPLVGHFLQSKPSGILPELLQQIIITGIITDSKGTPLPGVNVVVKGTTIGVISDVNGNYSISIPNKNTMLQFSYIGFLTEEREISASAVLDIVMIEDIQTLNEIVVVGYGIQKKATVVGAISQIKGKDIMKNGGVSSISAALTGSLPGLATVQSQSGQPGSENARLIIRSVTSWNGSDPLVLVDGVKRDMNSVEPNDVESISILKDASATAVYGVEGGNGVVLITTKRGAVGKPQLSFTGNVTMKTISRVPEVLNSYDGLTLKNQAILNELGMNPSSWDNFMPQDVLEHYRLGDNPEVYPNTNWRKYFASKPAYSQKAGFNVKGGTDFVSYFGSFNYLRETDILSMPSNGRGYDPSYSFNRFNFRTNLDFKLTKTTNFAVNLAGSRGSQKYPIGNVDFRISRWVFLGAPDVTPIYSDGVWYSNNSIAQGQNPVAEYNNSGIRYDNTTNFTTDFDLSQKLDFITKGLKFNVMFSYDNTIRSTGPNIADVTRGGVGKYIDPVKYTAAQTDAERDAATIWNLTGGIYAPVPGLPTKGTERYDNKFEKRLVYQTQLNYVRDFDRHAVSGMAVFKRQQFADASNWPEYREDWAGRVTYGYDDRYLFEANGAYNGSEKFGPGYRFGFFPSVSVGWTFSNERFIQDNLQFLSFGKIKYNNGKVGSDAGIARWLYLDSWARGSDYRFVSGTMTGYELGTPVVSTNSLYEFFNQSLIANPDAHWETAHKQNIGIETSFFNNFISINMDYYWERRKGIFMSSGQRTAIPDWFGARPGAANLGETEGKGWELEVKLNKSLKNGLRVYSNLSWTTNKDKVIYMEDALLLDDHRKREGFAIGQPKSRLNNGFYNSWDDIYTSVLDGNHNKFVPGQWKQIDFNADGKIDALDEAPYGYPLNRPQGTYNATIGAEYKGISLMVQFYGVYNVTRSENFHEFTADGSVNNWTSAREFHRDEAWTPERAANGSANYQIVSYKIQNANQGNFIYKDASYLRLKSVELSYNLGKSVLSFMGIQNARVYVNGNNLIFWSKLLNDVEDGNTSQGYGTGYPTLKRYNLGVEISF